MKNSDIVFIWENFGPGHADRCEAVASKIGSCGRVVGIEICGRSSTYEWRSESRRNFYKITLFPGKSIEQISSTLRLVRLLWVCCHYFHSTFFLCHYVRLEIFMLACVLRLLGRNVNVMADSKFDDYERSISREICKYVLHTPYVGGLASGRRSVDYLRFLGVPRDRIVGNYNALSIDRIRSLAHFGTESTEVDSFTIRYFIVVARLVPKKNLSTTIRAYQRYCAQELHPRRLIVLGSGPLEAELKDEAKKLGVDHLISWRGFLQTEDVCRLLAGAISLLLLSSEEQFGNVVIEASALGIPCIVSIEVGARDHLVRSGFNGFVLESDNADGAAYFMKLLGSDFELWSRMRTNCLDICSLGDVALFSDAVLSLTRRP